MWIVAGRTFWWAFEATKHCNAELWYFIFAISLNKLLNKVVWCRFQTPWRSCITVMLLLLVIDYRCQIWSFLITNVITSAMVTQITGISIVCSTVCSGVGQRKVQSSASLIFVRGIHWWPVDSPHKEPVTWKLVNHLSRSCIKEPICGLPVHSESPLMAQS